MKRKLTTLLIIFSITGLMITDSYFNEASTHVAGAPSGTCGSVANPTTCTSCHSGSNTNQTGWITSTIPLTGYVPGTIYTITGTATYAGRTKFGFEISPQNTAGTYLGTCIVTNTTETQLITGTGSNAYRKYVTHKSAGTTGSGSRSWSFNWTAPPVGSGDVTFYGTLLCANGNGGSSGDYTYKSSLLVHEDVSTGIAENSSVIPEVSVYPNPVSDLLNINYRIIQHGSVSVNLYNLNGQLVAPLLSEIMSEGTYKSGFKIPFNLNPGIYFVEISTETGKTSKRILIQQ